MKIDDITQDLKGNYLSKLLPSFMVSEVGDSITSNEEEETVLLFSESSENSLNVSLFFLI